MARHDPWPEQSSDTLVKRVVKPHHSDAKLCGDVQQPTCAYVIPSWTAAPIPGHPDADRK